LTDTIDYWTIRFSHNRPNPSNSNKKERDADQYNEALVISIKLNSHRSTRLPKLLMNNFIGTSEIQYATSPS